MAAAHEVLIKVLIIHLLLFLVSTLHFVQSAPSSRDHVIEELTKRIAQSQVEKTTPIDFPFSFYKQKGVYSSNIHIAFFGPPDDTLLRRDFKIFDNNAFVTLWITSVLLEVTKFKGPQPSNDQLLNALDAIGSYHDKNYVANSSILVFWTQEYNATDKTWFCGPANLDACVNVGVKDEKKLGEFLKIIGLEKYWEKIKPTIDGLLLAANAFVIPADFDDTYLNLGLGSLLKDYKPSPSPSPSPYQSWLKNNTNISSIINTLKKYAYRPYSSDFDSQSIDPRTYFYIRDFLWKSRPLGDLALVSTWVENINESKKNFYKSYRMPFGVNNVDLTVCSNVLYGLTSAVLSNFSNPGEWFDEDVQMIYRNTSSLVLYEIANNFSARPDLSLTYYPSVFNFYWFTSRTLNLLNSFDETQLSFPVLKDVKQQFSETLRGVATEDLLRRATIAKDYMYFDDFLGDKDQNIFGKPVNHGDDRICSTSMAVNTLFYTWNTGSTVLSSDTPASVRDTLTRSCKWLTKYAVSDEYHHMNAFFSGSIKIGPQDFPLVYPVNFIQHANGSSVSPDSHSFADVILAVSGLIPEDQYQTMLKETHFGFEVPLDFHGYNIKESPFPFWSSDAFTYAASLLALTQCSAYGF